MIYTNYPLMNQPITIQLKSPKLTRQQIRKRCYKTLRTDIIKSPKLLNQRINKRYYKTLGTSVINSSSSHLSLGFCLLWSRVLSPRNIWTLFLWFGEGVVFLGPDLFIMHGFTSIYENSAVNPNVASLEGVIQPVQWLQDVMEQTNGHLFFILKRRSLEQFS